MYRYRESHVAICIRPSPSALFLSLLSSTRKIRINAIHKSFSKYHSCKKHFNFICIKFSFSNWMRNSFSESLIPLCHWLKKIPWRHIYSLIRRILWMKMRRSNFGNWYMSIFICPTWARLEKKPRWVIQMVHLFHDLKAGLKG